ncbi:MAG TPA: Mut7-C RNAse domain-containing protein [Gammaproteobacteria bacterium]|nr:Mut7-C RNAse domain-containing protein [Gammaproteobacteria bacterium]
MPRPTKRRRAQDEHRAIEHSSEFRFYEELNDFLVPKRRQRSFEHRFTGNPSVKDAIEALGVPHTEIDVILVNGHSVDFSERLRGSERVAVYPTFERLDVAPLTRLRPEPLRVTRFVLDVHLGTLARYLRLIGFDTLWRNDYDDATIIRVAHDERRIILTRDRGILRNGRVTHAYWLRSTDPAEQLEEVMRALDLRRRLRPYSRCLECNGLIEPIGRDVARRSVPPRVLERQRDFTRCAVCGRVYWAGSHQRGLDAVVARARSTARTRPPRKKPLGN